MLFISIDIKFQFVFTALLQPELIIAFCVADDWDCIVEKLLFLW